MYYINITSEPLSPLKEGDVFKGFKDWLSIVFCFQQAGINMARTFLIIVTFLNLDKVSICLDLKCTARNTTKLASGLTSVRKCKEVMTTYAHEKRKVQ